jgi:hypothetical protein
MTFVLQTVTGVLLWALCAVILYRRMHHYCYSFGLYVTLQATLNASAFVWPAFYASWSVWVSKETLYALVRLSILAELSTLIFRTLPRARTRAYALLSIAALVLLVVLSLPYDTTSAYTLAKNVISRFHYVTAWGLIALLALVLWYRLPLHSFHKAILHGLLWLLLVHISIVFAAPQAGSLLASHVFHVVQLGIIGMWLWAAWAREPPWDKDEIAVIRYLQPWRAP